MTLFVKEDTLTTTTNRLEKVEAGLKFITSHFEEPILPRAIAVGNRFGIEVDSIAEIMYQYEKGGLIDCRINAYPSIIREGMVASSQLLVDIDRKQFDTDESFELAGKNTYSNFQKLGCEVTWLWTGGGYHFLLPQSIPNVRSLYPKLLRVSWMVDGRSLEFIIKYIFAVRQVIHGGNLTFMQRNIQIKNGGCL